jgi:putative tryptophan/tyrosine transport system substrate-binding protein
VIDRRRVVLFGLALAACKVHGQPLPARVFRIGVLAVDARLEEWVGWKTFVAELARRGYVEGRNLSFIRRYSGTDLNRLDAMAAELGALKVDLIFAAGGTRSTMAAKSATDAVPIVFLGSADPVGLGLVATLGHPGGNVTGSATLVVDQSVKSLEILVEAIGAGKSIAYIQPSWWRSMPTFSLTRDALQAAARVLGARLTLVDVDTPEALDLALQQLVGQGVGGVIIDQDERWWPHRPHISDMFIRRRLPAISDDPEFAHAGLLLSYSASDEDIGRKSAIYVDRILRGAKPADLPVEQVSTWRLVINLRTAKSIGLTMPRALLVRADEVIE